MILNICVWHKACGEHQRYAWHGFCAAHSAPHSAARIHTLRITIRGKTNGKNFKKDTKLQTPET